MNSKNIKALDYSANLCFKCLKEYDVCNMTTIHILDQGYGSIFDGFNSKLQLCPECYNKCDTSMWSMEIQTDEKDNSYKRYKHEEDIIKYIDKLPIEGKELFLNRVAWGNSVFSMNSQDWIDYNLKELPHDKCKEYGLISHDEKLAYEEKFPKCKYPVNMTFSDGSKTCYCPMGSYGKYGQEVDYTLYMHCYNCPQFKERSNDDVLLELKNEEGELYEIYCLYEFNKEQIEKILKGKKDK